MAIYINELIQKSYIKVTYVRKRHYFCTNLIEKFPLIFFLVATFSCLLFAEMPTTGTLASVTMYLNIGQKKNPIKQGLKKRRMPDYWHRK